MKWSQQEKKKVTVRKCAAINRYVNAGHINTPSEAGRHKQTALSCEMKKEKMQQMAAKRKGVDAQLPEN